MAGFCTLNNSYRAGSGDAEFGNGHAPHGRRELRSSEVTGALPVLGTKMNGDREASGSSELEELLQSLRTLFEHDRQVASQPDATRCGICYQHFLVSELTYREEGFYICPRCAQSLGNQPLPMLRKQQKMP
jgi:hypothetical protein